MLKPVTSPRCFLQRIGHRPLHPPAHVQLFAALQGCSSMVHIGEHGAQALANGVGCFAAEGFKGLVLTERFLHGQFRCQQQHQLPQLQGEAPLDKFRLPPRNAVKGEQEFLFQHAFTTVDAAGGLNSFGNGGTVHRLTEPESPV